MYGCMSICSICSMYIQICITLQCLTFLSNFNMSLPHWKSQAITVLFYPSPLTTGYLSTTTATAPYVITLLICLSPEDLALLTGWLTDWVTACLTTCLIAEQLSAMITVSLISTSACKLVWAWKANGSCCCCCCCRLSRAADKTNANQHRAAASARIAANQGWPKKTARHTERKKTTIAVNNRHRHFRTLRKLHSGYETRPCQCHKQQQ